MERNEELFRQVADAIEEHPESYDQTSYIAKTKCGTVACIAGWATTLVKFNGNALAAHEWHYDRDTGVDELHDCASAALGLMDDEASELFNETWHPHDGLSVPDALRKIGEGAAIEDVSA